MSIVAVVAHRGPSCPRVLNLSRSTDQNVATMTIEGLLSKALASSPPRAASVCVIIADIDGFWRGVKQFGVAFSPVALSMMHQVLHSVFGELHASFAEYGRDGLGVILEEATLDEALALAHTAVTEFASGMRDEGYEGSQLSLGVASSSVHGKSPSRLLQCCESALHEAKRRGPGSVALATNEPMVLKSNYYTRRQLGRLKDTSRVLGLTEASILREALEDYLTRIES